MIGEGPGAQRVRCHAPRIMGLVREKNQEHTPIGLGLGHPSWPGDTSRRGGYPEDTPGIPPSAVVVTCDRGACRRCSTERPVARALRLMRTGWGRAAAPRYIRVPGSKYVFKYESKLSLVSLRMSIKFDIVRFLVLIDGFDVGAASSLCYGIADGCNNRCDIARRCNNGYVIASGCDDAQNLCTLVVVFRIQ